MDEVLALAAEKLHRSELEISIHPKKYQLGSIHKEAQQLQTALDQGEEVIRKASAPAWVPRGLTRAFLFLAGRKDAVVTRAADQVRVKGKLDQLQTLLKQLNQEEVRLVLVPLSLADEGVVNAYYFKTRRHLASAIPDSEDQLEHQAREEAIDFGSGHYRNAKQLQLVTRKRVDGKLVPAFTEREAHALDMRVATEILAEHAAAFELSEEDLGKSAAPSTGA